jgi:hypothetical protein
LVFSRMPDSVPFWFASRNGHGITEVRESWLGLHFEVPCGN